MLELNKVYTWKEIETAIPNMWVIITDVKEKDGMIVSCKLLDICTKADKVKYLNKYLNKGIKFECERTTFNAPNVGILA